MAADSNDKSLLDRLNALKPTAVSLDASTNAFNLATTGIQRPGEPISREDTLSKRLKSLREGHGEKASPATWEPPPPYSEAEGGSSASKALSQRLHTSSPPVKKIKVESSHASRSCDAGKTEPLDGDEDRTLEEILDGLVLEDDQWSMSEDEGDKSASKRIEELLANLGEQPETHGSKSPAEMEQHAKEDGDVEDDDDDSEGEQMNRQADNVLAKTMDELRFEGQSEPADLDQPPKPPQFRTVRTDSAAAEINMPDADLALPAAPQAPTADHSLPDLPSAINNGSELTLPTVPTILQDPVPSSNASDDPFESSIAARLAALKGPGHKPIATDDFGLPSAPTFQPEDRPVPKVAKTPGYSDEDMKTWCVVCLEDATVRCVGCDGDVYCARCWREMHVGPSAGYDERGHAWEKFDPRKM